MDLVEYLEDVINKISLEERWTQEAPARDSEGKPVLSINPRAVCWCLTGAMWKVAREKKAMDMYNQAHKVLEMVVEDSIGVRMSLTHFNDAGMRTHGGVLALLYNTIFRIKRARDEGVPKYENIPVT